MLIRSIARLFVLLSAATACAACSSSSGGAGGPVEGPADTHCGSTVQATDASVCMATGTPPPEEENATLYGSEGDDDDCKYHVKWSSTDIGENSDVTITVTLTNKSDGKPTTGADAQPEIFLSTTHPAPNSGVKTSEDTPGTYTIGPVHFDAPGRWTMRFHFFEECTEIDEASPHSHVGFYIDVP